MMVHHRSLLQIIVWVCTGEHSQLCPNINSIYHCVSNFFFSLRAEKASLPATLWFIFYPLGFFKNCCQSKINGLVHSKLKPDEALGPFYWWKFFQVSAYFKVLSRCLFILSLGVLGPNRIYFNGILSLCNPKPYKSKFNILVNCKWKNFNFTWTLLPAQYFPKILS